MLDAKVYLNVEYVPLVHLSQSLVNRIYTYDHYSHSIDMKKLKATDTGSMADIAFLLLVFFLVTTQINQDYGITTNLAKAAPKNDSTVSVNTHIYVNRQGKYLVNGEEKEKGKLVENIQEELDSRQHIKNVITINTDRNVGYDDFIYALNAGKKATNLFYQKKAMKEWNTAYKNLSSDRKIQLKKRHPIVLVENEND